MPANLVISGGIFHPFDESSSALAAILREAGIESEIYVDIDAAVEALGTRHYDMLTVNALRWSMQTGDKYAPYRDEWAYQVPPQARERLADFVHSGGALLGMHTASICFDDWPGWGDVLGGRWRWGESHHPPLGPVTAQPTERAHPITDGIASFELIDEIYHGLELAGDVEALATGTCKACDGPQPILWARRYGSGRVVYDALGHDAASMNHPEHRLLIAQAAQWLLDGQTDGDTA